MAGVLEAAKAVGTIVSALNKSGAKKTDVNTALKDADKRMDTLYSTKGSVTKLLSDFIVEPMIVITENASTNEVVDKVAELTTDVFAAFYMQAFEVINKIYNIDTPTTVALLSTDNGMRRLKDDMSKRVRDQFKVESAYDLFGNSAELTVESSLVKGDTSEVTATALLQRNLEVSMKVPYGEGKYQEIKVPIIVRARIIKVKLDTILLAISPKKSKNSLSMSWLEYRSGIKTLGDFLFSTNLIKEYKEQRIKGGDEFLKILSERKASATAKLAADGAIGFEKRYNSYIITEDDRIVINKELGGDIYKERFKDQLLDGLYGMSVSVLDEDHERLVVLTSDIRGVSDTSFRSLKKNKDKGGDLSELVKAIFSSRPLF